MRNLTTFVADKEIEIYHATEKSSGYGHKEIIVEIKYNDDYKKFRAVTNNMPSYDEAMDLEGNDKHYALYCIIENQIIDDIAEWLEELEY